jgi:hypothetical protein
MNLSEILAGAHVALKIIQARLLAVLAMLGCFALFSWAMWLQTVLAAIIAGAWGVIVFLPVLYTGRRGGYDAEPTTEGSRQRSEDVPARPRAA